MRGPHVFYENNPDDLHLRHPFSYLKPPLSPESGIDVVALDCEMIYTTGEFRVARVSVVDGSGTVCQNGRWRPSDVCVLAKHRFIFTLPSVITITGSLESRRNYLTKLCYHWRRSDNLYMP